MNCATKCAWLFLSSLLFLAELQYHEVNGLAFDDLDFARATMESVAKSITSKPTSVYDSRLWKSDMAGSVVTVRSDRFSSRIKPKVLRLMATIKKGPMTTKPRNLNKFNEAMDQVERAMVQAELSRKTAKLTDLRKDITDAVNRGNVR